jgi:hypothetical protein
MSDLTTPSTPQTGSVSLVPDDSSGPKPDASCDRILCNFCGADVASSNSQSSENPSDDSLGPAPGPYVCRHCRPHAAFVVRLLSPSCDPVPQPEPAPEEDKISFAF